MFELFSKGYLESCPAPNGRCRCEATMLMVVALLALLAGGIQAVLGYYYSMAILSDSSHALADAGADFFGAYIAFRVLTLPLDEWRLSFLSNKVIAGFIVVASELILIEAVERLATNEYLVSPLIVLVVGTVGYWIDTTRTKILWKAKLHYASQRIDGYIDHARTDAIHSLWVAIIGGITFFVGLLPQIAGSYKPFVQLLDFGATIYISIWMMKIGWDRWQGKAHVHSRGSECGHGH